MRVTEPVEETIVRVRVLISTSGLCEGKNIMKNPDGDNLRAG
jgi:hypothetical protein